MYLYLYLFVLEVCWCSGASSVALVFKLLLTVVDPMSDGSRRSDLLIGAVIGGTAAAVIAAIIVIVTVRLCRQWRQYQKAVQSALGELQCHSPDGAAITPSRSRRDSSIGTFFSFFVVSGHCTFYNNFTPYTLLITIANLSKARTVVHNTRMPT